MGRVAEVRCLDVWGLRQECAKRSAFLISLTPPLRREPEEPNGFSGCVIQQGYGRIAHELYRLVGLVASVIAEIAYSGEQHFGNALPGPNAALFSSPIFFPLD